MATQTMTRLDEQTIKTVKATAPVLAEHGEKITTRFYQLMFEAHPELKNIFNMTHQEEGKQPRALAGAVYAAAQYIDDLSQIMPAVEQIANKHRSLNIKPEHYPIVGKYLLLAIKDVLGDAATDDIMEAWRVAYGEIAEAFIQVEAAMYKETEEKKGGWVGYRDFEVFDKVKESDVITSFYLKPVDGGALPTFKPGQYLTIKAQMPGEKYEQLRQYSLSDSPGREYFRISVKREDGTEELPEGKVSTFLHEQVKKGDVLPVSAPAGDFFLDKESKNPLVLISGGVGLTPMMSMLQTLINEKSDREVHFIHAARNGSFHALKDDMKKADQLSNVKTYIIYDSPTEEDMEAMLYTKEGYIDLPWLQSVVPQNADFYFCGPEGFMRAVNKALKEWHVPADRINYEFFGPKGDIES
ncbi:NO-inducible flavohemoprotein [Thalassobacillus pellis]|uniref:NO-inducible flavohemoprotein n=1 Tax=Thalassobacillus pellis TaxID=748008 RepID=UPI001961338E|nr:NO-inducible flavohemoprotein [Thalassobacillus pellis]MBM7552255.1 nitric oxide dioxygenase [Thalassobacillus pellis]